MTDIKEYKAWNLGYIKGVINTLRETKTITKWLAKDMLATINFIEGEQND